MDVQRSADRYLTETDDVTTRHSFSYGAHYDPDNIAFGPIIAINEESVRPGAGYDAHHHADVEIVTWVLDGALAHEDTTGHRGIIEPGTAQRLSAGTGVQHAERNASRTEPLRFVQMMLASEHVDEPEYASVDVDPEPGVLTPTVPVHAPAELFVLHLEAGQTVTVPGRAPQSRARHPRHDRGRRRVAGGGRPGPHQRRSRVRSECVRPRGRADLAAAEVTR